MDGKREKPWGVHPANDEARRKWQNPEAILGDIGLKPGLTFIDLGCGGGFFTLPAARIAGAHGKVYGLDVDETSINELRSLAAGEGLRNIELLAGKAEDLVLCKSCADIVFLGNVLHDFQDAGQVLANARQMLKPEGRLINLDWKKEAMSIGPPLPKRFSKEKAVGLIAAAGFSVESLREAGVYHYVILARPASDDEKYLQNKNDGESVGR